MPLNLMLCVPSLSAYADVSSGARGLIFGLSLRLHPYFMYASSEGSSETAHLCRLT